MILIDKKGLMRRNLFVYYITRKLARFLFSLFYKIRIDKEDSLPENVPLVILPKHQYWTDIPLISFAFKKMLYFVAKKELFRFPIIKHYLFLLGGIPINRRQTIKSLESLKMIISLLKIGGNIVIFPEGTYFRNEIGPIKNGLLQIILNY